MTFFFIFIIYLVKIDFQMALNFVAQSCKGARNHVNFYTLTFLNDDSTVMGEISG